MTVKEQLAKYWELGWIAFPISLGWNPEREKKDLQAPKGWQNLDIEATKALPPRTAIAIQTGCASGIIVLDIDDVDGWQRFLDKKEKEAPNTVTARSQSGGLHYYFKWTEAIADLKSTSALLGGCADIRNRGGMIIAAPSSFHVPGESARRCYAWLEGKSPWDRELAEMPDWLVQALRETGGGTVSAKRGGQQAQVQLEGPDTAMTPESVKEFIAQNFAIMPVNIGNTRWLADGAGYSISTNEHNCFFKKVAHKSNRQYIYVSSGGEMSRRCHDGECRDQKWGLRKAPVDVLQAIHDVFPCKAVVVAEEIVNGAREEAVAFVNDVHPGNGGMAMVHKPGVHAFEGALDTYFGRNACPICGSGRLVATANKDGLAIQCDGRRCQYRSPAIGAMPVSTEKYPRLGNFFAVVNQQINVAAAAEPTASWIDFA
ncbi:hypothetical protein HDU93_000780, partial [Gonapodya sp. JEL0774]